MTDVETRAPEPQPGANRTGKILRRLLPWVVLAGVLALLFNRIPFERVAGEFHRLTIAQVLGLGSLSIVFILGVCAIDAVALRYAFGLFQIRMEWRELFLVRAATMVLVAIASPVGQAGIAGHLVRTGRAKVGESAGMIVFLMMIEFFGMLAVATVFFPLLLSLGGDGLSEQAQVIPAAAMIIGLWPLLFIVMRLAQSQTGVSILAKLRLASLIMPLQNLSARQIAVLLAIKTILALWQIAITLPAFWLYQLKLPALDLFAFMPLAIILSSIPITPAKLGITQASWVWFFHYTVEPSALVAFSLIFQVLLNAARWAIGAAVMPFFSRLGTNNAPSGR